MIKKFYNKSSGIKQIEFNLWFFHATYKKNMIFNSKPHFYVSLGDAANSIFWLSLEIRPSYSGRCFEFCKTYNGTKGGLVWVHDNFTVIGHMRDKNYKY